MSREISELVYSTIGGVGNSGNGSSKGVVAGGISCDFGSYGLDEEGGKMIRRSDFLLKLSV